MLITDSYYRLVTHDYETAASAVEVAVGAVTGLLDDACSRKLIEQERTEACLIIEGPPGIYKVYPDAYPITSCSAPTGAQVAINQRYIAVPSPLYDPILADTDLGDGWASLTYVGGFTESTCPASLKLLIAELAYALGHSGVGGTSGVPAGATSVRLGDAAITFGTGDSTGALATLERLVPGCGPRVSGWRKRT